MRITHTAHLFECLVPAGGTVWEELGGLALLEEVCHWKWTSRFKETVLLFHSQHSLSHSLCLCFMLQHHACLPVVVLPAMIVIDSHPLKSKQFSNKLFPLQVPLAIMFYHSNRKGTENGHQIFTEPHMKAGHIACQIFTPQDSQDAYMKDLELVFLIVGLLKIAIISSHIVTVFKARPKY